MHRRLLGLMLFAGLVGCGGDDASITGDDDVTPGPDARWLDGGDDRDAALVDAGPAPDAEPPPFPFVRCAAPTDPLPPLVEDRAYYEEDTLEVMEISLQISDLAGFAAVNAGVLDAEVAVVFTEGDYTGSGSLRIRGGKSRENAQKNYKVELADEVDRWNHQREINLNKHMTDMTRVRNKLAFDLFQTVPDLTSLRTRFAHLTINGQSFGLYTWIEEPDQKFLKFHGLDPDGALYKANYFYFQPIAASVAADEAMLEVLIDPKENPDNDKLRRMLDALHAPDLDVDAFFATYFQHDNLVTWLATNILLNDVDTLTQNFYLYSPSSCEGWYLLPWDYDGAWGFYAQNGHADTRERWQSGLTNWWVSDLFEEFYRSPANVAAVEAKVLALSQTVLTDAITTQRLAAYHAIVQPYITAQPDLANFPASGGSAPAAAAKWQAEWTRVASTTSRFFAEYHDVLERPMPIRLSVDTAPPEFAWKRSFDLQGDPLTYDLQVARTPEFLPSDLVMDIQDTTEDEWPIPALPPGAYYWRVVVEDHQHPSSWQLAYESYAEHIVP